MEFSGTEREYVPYANIHWGTRGHWDGSGSLCPAVTLLGRRVTVPPLYTSSQVYVFGKLQSLRTHGATDVQL